MTALRKMTKTNVTTELETITPGEARQILEANVNNRRLDMGTVKYYQRQIEKGAWQVNGESIKIADDGALLDGQHRLHAIVKANVPVKTFVVRGLSTESYKTIDAGKTRRGSDYLKVNGIEGNLNVLAAAARVAMNFDTKTGRFTGSTEKLNPTDLIWFVEKHPGLVDSVKYSDKLRKVASQSNLAGCHYIFSLVDPEATQNFFEALETGAGLSASNPVLTVRNRLLTLRTERRAGSSYQKMIVAYLVQAFNYYRAKKPLSNSVYTLGNEILLNDFAGAVL